MHVTATENHVESKSSEISQTCSVVACDSSSMIGILLCHLTTQTNKASTCLHSSLINIARWRYGTSIV